MMKPMGRLLVVPHLRRHTCSRILALIVGLCVVTYLTVHHVRSNMPKLFPTEFPPDSITHAMTAEQLAANLPPPKEKAFRTIDRETLNIDGDRYIFLRNLAHGYEGQSRIYLDGKTGREVVVKTFFGSTRVNPLPEHLKAVFNPGRTNQAWLGSFGRFLLWPLGIVDGGWGEVEYWPTEIPGITWFTGWRGDAPQEMEGGSEEKKEKERAFVEMIDYFYLSNRWIKNNWQLVMPYYEDGTLDGLAKIVRHLGLRPEEVDRVYRKEFLKYLDSLRRMHEQGYCHNDIKVDNIFVSRLHNGTSIWLVSDIGNLRQFTHAIYSGRNCRLNDVESAVRTYIWFLRLATGGKHSEFRHKYFDEEFYRGRKGWSWVYWEWKSLDRERLEEVDDVVGEIKKVFDLEFARRGSTSGPGGLKGASAKIVSSSEELHASGSSGNDGPARIPTSFAIRAAQVKEFIKRVTKKVDEMGRDLRWWKRGNMEMPSWLWRDDIVVEGWQRSDDEIELVGMVADEESVGVDAGNGGALGLRPQVVMGQSVEEGEEMQRELLEKAVEWELGQGGKRGFFDVLWRKLDGPS